MPFHTIHPESSPFDEITRGIATGFRLFIRTLVTLAIIAIAGVLLYKAGVRDPGESGEAVDTHRDIRRSIAHAVRGAAFVHVPDFAETRVASWKELTPSSALLADDSGFDSRVEVRQAAGSTDFRIVIGPYDPEVSQNLKKSSGWVTLKLLQRDGHPVSGLESGIRIQLSRFEFHEVGGLPVGWSYCGSLGKMPGASAPEVLGFELGWVIPASTSVRPSSHISLR